MYAKQVEGITSPAPKCSNTSEGCPKPVQRDNASCNRLSPVQSSTNLNLLQRKCTSVTGIFMLWCVMLWCFVWDSLQECCICNNPSYITLLLYIIIMSLLSIDKGHVKTKYTKLINLYKYISTKRRDRASYHIINK